MLKSIQNIFKRKENESVVDSKKSEQELTYASLLIEVINSDNKFDDRERDKLLEILSSKLDIQKEELDNFTELAQKKSEDSTSLYEFTREINDQYEYEEKVSLITDLWGIAYSDGKLDKYEDYVIRKIADLIYVSHTDFIKSKLKVKNAIYL
ncbi:MAG: TerB family tellurite resistance protein [Pseudohongiellaceae bacterium]